MLFENINKQMDGILEAFRANKISEPDGVVSEFNEVAEDGVNLDPSDIAYAEAIARADDGDMDFSGAGGPGEDR